MEALAEVGFDAVHVELIAEHSGCSRPAFYQYFSSKHDIYWALARRLGEEMVTLADQLETVGRDADGVAHLKAWITEFMALHELWEPVFSSFQAASRDHLNQARRSSGVSLRTDEALLRAFGLRNSKANERLMGAMVALLDRSSHYAEQTPADVDREPFVAALAELFHRVVFGPIERVNLSRTKKIRRHRPTVPPPLPREVEELPPRRARTRQRLVEAGLQVLPTRGFHDTRVDDICKAAGLSHGTFYRYFEQKDDFFRALAEPAAGRAVDLLGQLVIDGPEDELRAWCLTWLRTYQADGGIFTVWQEMRRTSRGLGTFSQQVAAAMFTQLVQVLERRGFGNPEADATSMLALLERLPNNVYTLGFTTEKASVDIMTTILRRGYWALEGSLRARTPNGDELRARTPNGDELRARTPNGDEH